MILLLAFGVHAAQAAVFVSVPLDVDNNPATGCNVSTPEGPFPGAELVVLTQLDTSANLVTGVFYQTCLNPGSATLSPPVQYSFGSWPIGIGLGTLGSDVVESFLPLALIQSFVERDVLLGFATRNTDDGSGDAVFPPATLSIPAGSSSAESIPLLPGWGIALLSVVLALAAIAVVRKNPGPVAMVLFAVVLTASGVGLVWAAINPDGDPSDWQGIPPLATDPIDSTPLDIVAVFAAPMNGQLALRVDAFIDTVPGTITIVKDTVPDDGQDFGFTTDIPEAAAGFSLDDDADATLPNSRTFTGVIPGTYTVSETATAGYSTELVCIDPDNGTGIAGATATIDLDAGESVTCTFTNSKTGTITIVKDAVPDDAQDFAFTTTGGLTPAGFSLDDDADGTLSDTQVFTDVAPGSYTVSETPVAGYDVSLSCTDPDGGSSTVGATATIDLDPDESVTCTFTNTKTGTITIVKDAVPDDAQDFAFTTTGGLTPAGFSLDDDADGTLSDTQVFTDVSPGSYTVSETAVAGYDVSLSCTDPDGGSSTAGATATIDLDAGESVTCTFTNTKAGTITIVKDTVPDDGQDFAFTTTGGLTPAGFSLDDDADGTLSDTQVFTGVAPGSYTVSETAVAGYDVSLSCTDPDGGSSTAGATATIDLDAGESVTCTFTNTAQGTLTIIEDTVPNGGQDFAFTTTGGLTPAGFSLDDDADGTLSNTQTFNNVTAGSYTVSQTPVAGFALSLSCTDPDGGSSTAGATATIDLDPGETVSCTYTNLQTVAPSAVADPDGGLPGTSTPSNDGTAAATDDPYHTARNTSLTVPDGVDDLLTNDTLGTPTASLTHFGPTVGGVTNTTVGNAGASENGGSLTVNADGSFTYSPPTSTFTGLDSFYYRIGNIAGNSDAQATLAVGLRPACVDDSYSSTGNVGITLNEANGLIQGTGADSGDQIAVTEVEGAGGNVGSDTATDQGGVVNVAANGSFDYSPPAGHTGSDTFQYKVGNGFGDSTECEVTITVSNRIWFIDNTGGGSGGTGTLDDPFLRLADFNTANGGGGDNPAANHCIHLEHTGTDYQGPISLLNGQLLIGEGASGALQDANACNLTLPTHSKTLPTLGGTRPQIASATGDGVELASGNTVRGLNVQNTPAGFAFDGTAVGSPVINQVSILGTGGAIRVATSGTFGSNVSFGTLESNGSTSAIDLTGVTGTLGIGAAGSGITGATAAAVSVSGGSVGFTYPGNITQANNAAAVSVGGGHTGSLTFNTGTINATNGSGLQFNNADGTYNFNGTNTLNGGDAGIDIINGSNGAFTFSAASAITNPSGDGVHINGGAGQISYAGTIGNNAQNAVEVANRTGNTVTFSGAITESGAGIVLNNNDGGATLVQFTGTVDISNSSATAVTFQNSTGTASFVDLDVLNTASNQTGLFATANNGGGRLNVNTGTINAGSGRAVDIDNTVLGNTGSTAAGLTLVRVDSVGGGVPGIDLASTTGAFTVAGSGDGTVDCRDSAGACAGGSITGKAGNVDGVLLNSVTNVFLNEMNISSNTRNGIFGTAVNGFTIDDSRLVDNADQASPNESGLNFDELTGTALAGSNPTRISSTRVQDSYEQNVEILNTSGTLAELRVENSIFTNDGGSTFAGTNFNFLAEGTSNMTLDVRDSEFIGNRVSGATTATGLYADSLANAVMDVTIQGPSALSVFEDNNNAINVSSTSSGTVDFDIDSNGTAARPVVGNLSAAEIGASTAINVVMSEHFTGAAEGFVTDNFIGKQGVTESGSATSSGILTDIVGTGTFTVAIENNTVRETDSRGIRAWIGNAVGGGGDMDVSVINNTMDQVTSNGIYVRVWNNANQTLCAKIEGNAATNTTSDHVRMRHDAGTASLEVGAANLTDTPVHVLTTNNASAASWLAEGTIAVVNNGTCLYPTP